jgi:hypothetical protein
MKKVFLLSIIILFFSAVASPASAFFNDNLNDYPLGTWGGNGDWIGGGEIEYIGGDYLKSGKLSKGTEEMPNSISISGNSTSTGLRYQGFDIWFGGSSYGKLADVYINSVGLRFYEGSLSFLAGLEGSSGTWPTYSFSEGTILTAFNCDTEQFWIKLDDGEWSEALELNTDIRPFCLAGDTLSITNGSYWGLWQSFFDNFVNHLPAVSSGTFAEPSILPVFPVNCEYNSLQATGSSSTIDFTAEVNVSNPEYSSTTWDLIYFNYEDIYSHEIFQFSENFIGLPDSLINITSEISLASSTYKVDYYLAGINDGSPDYFGSYCPNTSIGTAEPPPEEIIPVELPSYTAEDCSGMATLERLVCEMKNGFHTLFYPSSEKLTELKKNTDLIGTKFPFNYISVSKTFFTSISSGLNENEAISLSIFGSTTGDLSFSALASTTKSYGGQSLTLLGYIKNFLTLIVFLIIIKWFISYVKRIFK